MGVDRRRPLKDNETQYAAVNGVWIVPEYGDLYTLRYPIPTEDGRMVVPCSGAPYRKGDKGDCEPCDDEHQYSRRQYPTLPPSRRRILFSKPRIYVTRSQNRPIARLEMGGKYPARGSIRKDVAQPCPRLLPLPQPLDRLTTRTSVKRVQRLLLWCSDN